MPDNEPADGNRTPVMGVQVDIVGSGTRSEPEREFLEDRLRALMRATLEDARLTDAEPAWAGDGMRVILPPHTDPAHALTALLTTTSARLARDNAVFKDTMRLRMALDFGLARHTEYGPTGNLVVDLSRLIDSPAIRGAVTEYQDWDLIALISNRLYELVRPEQLALKQIVVKVKEYSSPAWLWCPAPAQP